MSNVRQNKRNRTHKTTTIEPETAPEQTPQAAAQTPIPDWQVRVEREERERPVYAARGNGLNIAHRIDDASLWALVQMIAGDDRLGAYSIASSALDSAAHDLMVITLAAANEETSPDTVSEAILRLQDRLFALAELDRRFQRAGAK